MIFSLNPYLAAQETVVFEEWASPRGVQEYFYKNVTKTDAARNVYVAGATLNGSGDYDLLITKFDRRGQLLWTNSVAGPGGGHDFATDLAFDHSGNVVVSGSVAASGSENNNMLAVKYNAAGTELWQYSHDHNGNAEGAASLVIDAANNIYLTGATQQSGGYTDIITIKIDSTAALQWEEVFDYDGLHDAGIRIELSGPRAVVTGGAQHNSITWKVMTLSYLQVDGALTGSTTSAGNDPGVEEVTDMVIDQNDNIYIAGSTINGLSGYDMLLIKLDEDLNIEWTKEWDGDGMTDKGSGVRVAPNGDVYLSGTTETTEGDDIALIKLNSDGDYIWEETYNSEDGIDDVAAALEWHDEGYLYIAGHTFKVSNRDYLTLKYDSTGTLLWDIAYNSPYNKDDRATNLALDDEGDIIVSGQCEKNDSVMTYYTVKFSESSLDSLVLDHIGNSNLGFMRQMGQLSRTDSTIADSVKYYIDRFNPRFYAADKRISYVVSSSDSLLNYIEQDTSFSSVELDVHRMDLEFLNCDRSCKARALDPLDYYTNHYFPHCAPGVVRIPYLEKIFYQSVWTGIDVYLSSTKCEEYTFRLDVGAKPNDIKFKAVGADSLLLLDNDLKFALASGIENVEVGDFHVYQVDTNGELQELAWQPRFEIDGQVISFDDFGSYNVSLPLIVSNVANTTVAQEDGFCWSTFFGGSGHEFGISKAVKDDEFAIAGWTTSLSTLPQNPGEFSTGNEAHGFVAKFDEDGVFQWSLLYGGNSGTHFNDVVFDNNNNVLVAGETSSDNLLTEATGDAYIQTQTSASGFGSALIAEFSEEGDELIWGTYFGGTGEHDEALSIEISSTNDRFVAGYCDNSNGSIGDPDFPLEEGNFGAYYNENASDRIGFIAQFDESNVPLWSTLIEGSGHIYDLLVKQDGEIAILGKSWSEDLPVTNGGNSNSLFNAVLNGNSDMFYGVIDEAGQFEHLTYIGGSGNDELSGDGFYIASSTVIAEDSQRNIYIIGNASDGLELQQQGAYEFKSVFSNDHMPFVYKIDDTTYELEYGSYLYDLNVNCAASMNSVEIDEFDNLILASTIYPQNLSGEFDDLFPIQSQGDAYSQDEIYSNTDTGYLLVQNEAEGVLYATYLGGSYVDYLTSVFVMNGNLFLVGFTASDIIDEGDIQFPIFDPQSNAYFQESIGGDPGTYYQADVFLSKICFDFILDIHETDVYSDDEKSPFNIFPNPVTSEFTVLSSSNDVAMSDIDLIDISGKLVQNHTMEKTPFQITIRTTEISTGMYFVRIRTTDNELYTYKLVIE